MNNVNKNKTSMDSNKDYKNKKISDYQWSIISCDFITIFMKKYRFDKCCILRLSDNNTWTLKLWDMLVLNEFLRPSVKDVMKQVRQCDYKAMKMKMVLW